MCKNWGSGAPKLSRNLSAIDTFDKSLNVRHKSGKWEKRSKAYLYASAVFAEEHTVGEWKMCTDFRILNCKTWKYAYHFLVEFRNRPIVTIWVKRKG